MLSVAVVLMVCLLVAAWCSGELSRLETDLQKAEEAIEKSTAEAGAANRMLRDTVTVDDISGIVAKWTVSVATMAREGVIGFAWSCQRGSDGHGCDGRVMVVRASL